MLTKDFENYELKLKKLREEQRQFYEKSLKIYDSHYARILQKVIPQDVFDIAGTIRDVFCVQYAEHLMSETIEQNDTIFEQVLETVISQLALNREAKIALKDALLYLTGTSQDVNSFGAFTQEFHLDPHSAIIESMCADGKISQDEFILLQKSYSHRRSFQTNISVLGQKSRNILLSDWREYISYNPEQKQQDFLKEFGENIKTLESRGYHTQYFTEFLSQGYFISKNRKESPKNRLKRTFKIGLLKLLSLGRDINIDALLARFELCESFDDYFFLVYKLFEVLGDGILETEEYIILEKTSVVKQVSETLADTRQKILDGEKATLKISNIFSVTDDFLEEKSDAWKQKELYAHIFDDSSYILGQEIHFGETQSGVLAEADREMRQKDEIDIDTGDTLEGNYERLKFLFFELDEQKRKSFASGDYTQIDEINAKLSRIQSQLEKIIILLGYTPGEEADEVSFI